MTKHINKEINSQIKCEWTPDLTYILLIKIYFLNIQLKCVLMYTVYLYILSYINIFFGNLFFVRANLLMHVTKTQVKKPSFSEINPETFIFQSLVYLPPNQTEL